MVQAYFRHNHENEREQRPVTRSSCVFYFSRFPRTQIHFLNYWSEKRGIKDLSLRITLRSMVGDTLFQTTRPIMAKGGHVIEVNDLLGDSSALEGSIELEFLSSENLVIAYPAALVRYIGADWHTVAHSSQRYFSESSGDEPERITGLHDAEEGNITIHENGSPFFFLHNGPRPISSAIEVSIASASGRTITTIKAMKLLPYQTMRSSLADYVDFKTFLAGERGTFTLRFASGGIFPRLIAGSDFEGRWSIDHTNFASTEGAVASDVFPVSDTENFKDLVFNLPNNFAAGWKCWADIYPTYPDDNYAVELRGSTVQNFSIDKRNTPFPRIELPREPANYEFLFKHPKALPRRFHMGIHYQIGDGPVGFLTDGPLPHTTAPIKTRWLPLFDPATCDNRLLIANRTAGSDEPEDITFALRLFNSFGDEPLLGSCGIPANGSVCLGISDLFPEGFEFLNNGCGWLYMTASKPQRSVIHYASVFGANSIAVCHAF